MSDQEKAPENKVKIYLNGSQSETDCINATYTAYNSYGFVVKMSDGAVRVYPWTAIQCIDFGMNPDRVTILNWER